MSVRTASLLIVCLGVVPTVLGQDSPPPEPAEPPEETQPSVPDKTAAEEEAREAFRAGDYAKARDAADRVLETHPDDPVAHYIAGVSQLRLGELDAAEAHLNAVEAASPKWPGLQFQFGYLAFARAEDLTEIGEGDKAREQYIEAARRFGLELERAPDQVASLSSRAVALAKADKVDEAIAAHEAWIAAQSDDSAPVVSLGTVLARAGRAEAAAALFDRLPDRTPEAIESAATAWAAPLYESDQPEAALPFLEKALAVDPGDSHTVALMVGVWAKTGDLDRTASGLARYLALDPPASEAEQVGELIRSKFEATPGSGAPALQKLGSTRYPRAAIGANIRTDVTVLARIGVDGRPAESEMLLVPNRIWQEIRTLGFEEAAFDAVRRSRFEPGTNASGKPVARYAMVTVTFEP